MTTTTSTELKEIRDLILQLDKKIDALDKKVDVNTARTEEKLDAINQRLESMDKRMEKLEDGTQKQVWALISIVGVAVLGILGRLLLFPSRPIG